MLSGAATAKAEVGPASEPAAVGQTAAATELEQDPLALAPPLAARLAPSPVRSGSTLSFRTTESGALHVALYDTQGRRVRTLLDQSWSPAGSHHVPVDARGDQGALGPGVYFYRIEAEEGSSSGRLVIAR